MASAQSSNAKLLNAVARELLRAHVSKPVVQGWRYSAKVAMDTICKTFAVSATDSATALLALMAPDRLAQFPHDDFFDLAQAIKFLGPQGDQIILRLFEAAFEGEPRPGQWEEFGSAILPMRIQTSDQWNSIHYSLTEYYTRRSGENAAFMTQAACCAWNAVVRRRENGRDRESEIVAEVEFRGVQCQLPRDYSHIWGRDFAPEEQRILSHFENLLRSWATENDAQRIEAALDAVAGRNRNSLIWSLLMDVGTEFPESLGYRLEPLLSNPLCLCDADYAYSAAALVGALHKSGDATRRDRLERIIVEMPTAIRVQRADRGEEGDLPPWALHSQNRLLATLEEAHIVSPEARLLWTTRNSAGALGGIERPAPIEVTTHTYSDEELIERRGVNLSDPENAEMLRLRNALKPFADSSSSFTTADVERDWPLIAESEKAVALYKRTRPEMSQELWGYLVAACAKIARQANWNPSSEYWQSIRRILLEGAHDPVPEADDPDSKYDSCSAWGWPSPRIDAATGLPRLTAQIAGQDEEVASALRALSHDKSAAVRFNLADVLPLLNTNAPVLMWELIDTFIPDDANFAVLDAVVHSLNWLWSHEPEKVAERLQTIQARVSDAAPTEHRINQSLAHSFVFEFLRTGRADCEKHVAKLTASCGEPRATNAMLPQLHVCRAGGWMTAGDPAKADPILDPRRRRAWKFLLELLTTANSKLMAARQRGLPLKQNGKEDEAEFKDLQAEVNRLAQFVDGIASQLYFGSGAFRHNQEEEKLSPAQTERFWREAAPLLKILASEPHPHTAYEVVQTLDHLLPCDPEKVFLLAAESIRSSSTAGFQFESLAVPVVVKIVQRVLADHREILQENEGCESPALQSLLEVLDIFVEAGWPQARSLTHRLEEIYR